MTLLQIILLIALGLLIGAAAAFLFSWKHTEKNAPKFDVLGTVSRYCECCKCRRIKRAVQQRMCIQDSRDGGR